LTHHGVRCCVPAERVLDARQGRPREDTVTLWGAGQEPAEGLGERSLQLQTADGPRWVWGSAVRPISVAAEQVQHLPPILGDLLTLPHVVGLAALGDELVWLVEPLRFSPERARGNIH